jgi:hypothetical protein
MSEQAFGDKLSEALGRELALRKALKECSDDLEAYIEHHYDKVKDQPAMTRRYDRDMEPVKQARKLLG